MPYGGFAMRRELREGAGAIRRLRPEAQRARQREVPDGARAERRTCQRARGARRRSAGGRALYGTSRCSAPGAAWHLRCSAPGAVRHFAPYGEAAVRHLAPFTVFAVRSRLGAQPSVPDWRRTRRRSPMPRRLLVRVRELDQHGLTPRSAEDRHAGGQHAATRETHRDVDRRKARRRREQLTVVACWCVQVTNETRRIAPRRIHERVQPQAVHLAHDGRA